MLQLSGQKLKSLKEVAIKEPEKITTLDVSFNNLKDGTELRPFINLQILNIDSNQYFFMDEFPLLLKLETFSANKNSFSNF
jgi:Leucine-rich repeat (LRR) protein